MNKSFEQQNRISNQTFTTNHSQSNGINNSSNFFSETDKNNLFSFNLPANEIDIFDLSADIYDLPQANFFATDTSHVQESHQNRRPSNSNSNTSFSTNPYRAVNNEANNNSSIFQLQQNQQDKPPQEQTKFKSDIFGADVVTSLNLLSYTNKNPKNAEFKTLRDYDTSPEGYVDYNKSPDTDDIFFFERKNLLIQNHQVKLKNGEDGVDNNANKQNSNEKNKIETKETSNSKSTFLDSFGNSFFNSDFLYENIFDDQQDKQQIPQSQSPISQPHSSSNNESIFIPNRNFSSDDKPQHPESQPEQTQRQLSLHENNQHHIQSMPQFNINSTLSNFNVPFSSPSSTNDLYQYHQNSSNTFVQPSIQYQFQFSNQTQTQNQRSSTAPIPSPLTINNQMTSSTSTIPIDFSMGSMTTDDPNAFYALSAQSFNMAMSNRSLLFQPMALSFEPYEYWLFQERTLSFNDLVCKFFRHNKTNFTKFMYKLYDMLRITTVFPSLRHAVGVYFINNVAISVDKYAMINMLALNPKNVDGSLFHKQGNFPTHGFIEVSNENYKEAGFTKNPVYKSKSVRILFNKDHKFVNKVMSTAELDAIAYENKSKKTYKRK